MRRPFVELYRAATTVMETSNVEPGEEVLVYADSGRNPATVEAFQAAAVVRGARATVAYVSKQGAMNPPPAPALAAMKSADVIFDLASDSWLFTPATGEVLASNARMLQVICGEDTIVERGPDARVIARSEAAAALFAEADEMRVTSELGTEVVFRRGGRPIVRQAGCVTAPGAWDSLGMGAVTFYPPETEAEGTLVLNGPLFLIPQHQFVLDDPVSVRVEQGMITEVDVDSAGGRLLDEWLRSWDDPEIYGIAVVGVGLDHRARIEHNDIASWESFHGGVIVALGSNIMPIGGGRRESKSHWVAIVRDADVELDRRPIVTGGNFTIPELQ